MRIIYSLLIAVLFSACGGISPKKAAEIINSIDNRIIEIAEKADSYKYLTLDTFAWGNDTASVVVVYDNDKPVRVVYLSEVAADSEWDFFLDTQTGKTLYFLEKGLNLAEGCRFQNQFYYYNNKFVKGQTSVVACNHPGHQHDIEWADYQSKKPDSDFRLMPDAVDNLVKEIIAAVEADRPNLSPAANIARKRGAAYWAENDVEHWNVTVIPEKQIDFKFKDIEIVFTDFEEQPLNFDDNSLTYIAINDSTQIKLTFTLDSCTCNKILYPFSTKLIVNGETYNGCGIYF